MDRNQHRARDVVSCGRTSQTRRQYLKVTQTNLKQLAEQTSAHCDQLSFDFMRDKVFKVMYIRETGIINDNKLMCNDVKLFTPPVEIIEIEHRRIAEKDGDIMLCPFRAAKRSSVLARCQNANYRRFRLLNITVGWKIFCAVCNKIRQK